MKLTRLNLEDGMQFLANLESQLTLSSPTFDGCSIEFRRRDDVTTVYIDGEPLSVEGLSVALESCTASVWLHSDATIAVSLTYACMFDGFDEPARIIDVQPYETVQASFEAVARLLPRTKEVQLGQALKDLEAEVATLTSRADNLSITEPLLQKLQGIQELLAAYIER